MLIFDEKELVWIKNEIDSVLKIWNEGTKEQLKDFIEMRGGESLDTVLLFSNLDYQLFKHVNSDEFYNDKMVNWLWDNYLWHWRESDFTTAEEVKEFVDDEIYCQLFEKVYEYYVSLDDEEKEEEEN